MTNYSIDTAKGLCRSFARKFGVEDVEAYVSDNWRDWLPAGNEAVTKLAREYEQDGEQERAHILRQDIQQ